jgi:hypothetical protein
LPIKDARRISQVVLLNTKETINSGSAESSVAAPPIDAIADQHSESSEREREKEKKATQYQEERSQTGDKDEGEVANAKEEERQGVAGTVTPYVEWPTDKASR